MHRIAKWTLAGTLAAALVLAAPLARAEIVVGVQITATGSAAAIGIPYRNTFALLPKTLAGQPVRWVVLDDASDTTTAVRNARRLVSEDRADVIVGSTITPASLAVAEVAAETKTPQISLAPVVAPPDKQPWVFAIPQAVPVMIDAVVDDMKAKGVKTVGYIGFNDSWGEIVHKNLVAAAERAGLRLVGNERFNRTDTSVTAQALKLMSESPDAVLVGGSGTPSALPQIALRERGYKGLVYQTHGSIGRDFIRVGGKNVEGARAPTGPLMVAEELPDSNPIKKVSLDFFRQYEAQYGAGTRNAFSGYSYDAFLLLQAALPAALKKAKPGTPEFREALRESLENVKEVVGTHAVYTMTPKDHNGIDQRSRVMVQVENGEWKLAK
jgi:branched-chain amino acid transport system substrate-binding protein